MKNDISSVIDLYSKILSVRNETYNKRVGIFNQLIETFISKLFKDPKELVFEYNLKFSNNLLIESVSNNYDPINNVKIVDWILEKIENGSGVIKEQYNQEYLDSQEYYYTRDGKLVQGKKNALDGVAAKILYPDVKDLKSYPASINSSYVTNALVNQKNQPQKSNTGQEFQKSTEWAAFEKQLIGACQKNPTATNVSYKSSDGKSLKNYFCHYNWCNTNREQRYDPNKKLCKNNTSLSKIKEMGWDGFFEKLRELLNSAGGVATQVAIDFVGGGVGVEVVWLIMLGYDLLKPEKDWINIIVDIAGVVTFGIGGKVISNAFKSAGTMLADKGFVSVVEFISKNRESFEYLKKIAPTFENIFVTTIRFSEWILSIFGKYGESIINSMQTFKIQIMELVEVIAGKTGSKAVEKGGEKYIAKQGGETVKQEFDGPSNNYLKKVEQVVNKTSSMISKIAGS